MSSFHGWFQLGRRVNLITDGSIVTSSITRYVILTMRKPLLFTFLPSPMLRFSANLLHSLEYKTLQNRNGQVNSTFRARWLASSEVISQVLFTSEQQKRNKMAFVGIFSQIKLLFGPQVIQLMWYILKQLFTSPSVKVLGIYRAANYSPPLRWIIVKCSCVQV